MSEAFDCDVAGVRNFAGDVFLSCRRGSEWFNAIAMDVLNIEGVLKEVEETLPTEDLSMSRHEMLSALIRRAHKTLDRIQFLIMQHSSIDTQTRQPREISENGKSDVTQMKWNLIRDHQGLKEFLSTYQIVVHRTLKKLAKDHKKGRHPTSVLCSVTAFESLTSNDSNTWDYIYDDLERIQISREAFDINKAFILKWFERECLGGTFRDPRSPDVEYRMETRTMLGDASRRAGIPLKGTVLPTNPAREDTTLTPINTFVRSQQEPQTIEIEQHGESSNALPQTIWKEPPEKRLDHIEIPQTIKIKSTEERSDIVGLPHSIDNLNLEPGGTSVPRIVTPQSTSFWATNQDKALRSALDRHNFDKAGRCLEKGANIEAEIYKSPFNFPETPLIHFIELQNVLVVKWLLKEGANPGNTDYIRNKYTCGSLLPIVVSQQGNLRREGESLIIAQALLDHGAEIDRIGRIESSCIHSALYAAVVHRKIGAVQWLLDRGASFRIQESRRHDDYIRAGSNAAENETAFHAAARLQNTEMLQLFLDRGADIKMVNGSGQSVLHTAVIHSMASWGSPLCIEAIIIWLLDHGANVNSRDSHLKSPLFYAILMNQKANAARLLIKRGASVKAIKKMVGMTAIRYALASAHDDVALVFLEDESVDLREIDFYGRTLLDTAALGACLKSYKRLIHLGMDPKSRNKWGLTAYQEARKFFDGGKFVLFGRSAFSESVVHLRMQTFLNNAQPAVEQPSSVLQ